MKKQWITIIIILAIALIVGCTNRTNEESEVLEVKQPEVNTNNEDPSLASDTVAIADEENEDTDLVDVEVGVEKEVLPRYVLQSDHSIKPIEATDNERVVLLTIDDAVENYGVEIAKLLHEEEINAIFFVNGHFIANEAGREKLQTIFELGFEIGNHTMTHPNLSKISDDKQREEIVNLNDLIEEIIGVRPRFFRAPFGVNTDVSRQVMTEENMQAMNWTYGYDYFKEYLEKEALADIMVNTNLLRPGANLLMHDRKWTLEALPAIISGLKEKDYDFVDPKTIQ
jgi:peptidoglycan/xylan/chitin deacetylase (PgdA/CDA1 family)